MKSPILTLILFAILFTACDKSDGPAPIGQIFGKVIEDSTQTPVINIPVNLSKNQASAMTDSLGSFQFDSLQVGSDTITITTEYHDKLKQFIEVAEGPQEMTFQLNYNRGQIKGVVKDGVLNNPIEGAVVYLSNNEVSDTTNYLGEFLLDSLFIGTDTIVVETEYHDGIKQTLEVMEGFQEQNFQLKYNRGQLKGFVRDNSSGDPLRNIYISLSNNGRFDTTSYTGEFFFDSLKTGEEEIQVYSAYTDSIVSSIDLSIGENQTDFNLKRLPCFDNRPTEDSTKKYMSGTYEQIMTQHQILVRFDSSLKDTTEIYDLLKKYNLKVAKTWWGSSTLYEYRNNYEAILCIGDGRKAAYYFTPFGKENFCNFGAEPKVEYAWALFASGKQFHTGEIIIKFKFSVTQKVINEFYERYGLRYRYTGSTNHQIVALTKASPFNPYDMVPYLKTHEKSIIDIVYSNLAQGTKPFVCE